MGFSHRLDWCSAGPRHKAGPRRISPKSGSNAFGLWYWRLDGGGPFARRRGGLYGSRAFLFPQMQIEQSERAAFGVERWSPGFVDYLFVAFNTSAAFSPTDTPVLRPWAKLLNMLQSLISITIVAVLVSRAVGVL